MPKVTHYVRKSDWAKYQAIKDKPMWLHDAIRGTDIDKYNKAAGERKEIQKLVGPALKHLKNDSLPDGGIVGARAFKGPLYRNKKKGKL